jgi:hypothetical protein
MGCGVGFGAGVGEGAGAGVEVGVDVGVLGAVGVELPAVDGAAVLDELVKELGEAVPPHPLRREMRVEIDANNTMLAMAFRASCMEPSKLFGEYADLLDASIERSTYFDLGRIRRPTVSTLRQNHREELELDCFRMFAAVSSESCARTKVAVVMKNSQRQSQSPTDFRSTYTGRTHEFLHKPVTEAD